MPLAWGTLMASIGGALKNLSRQSRYSRERVMVCGPTNVVSRDGLERHLEVEKAKAVIGDSTQRQKRTLPKANTTIAEFGEE